MNRREFHRTVAAALVSVTGGSRTRRAAAAEPQVDGARLLRHLQALGRIGRTADGGITRLAFSDADREARALVRDLMERAGLATRIDAAGNLIGRQAGADPSRPVLMTGSHIDSVPHGGNYDGPVGALGAIEAAHALADADRPLRHPLEVVVFANEEGGKTGSRAMSAEVEPFELELTVQSGKTIREGIAFVGGAPERLAAARRPPGSIAAFLELHVEQGGVLERRGIPIGVVEGIVGIMRWTVTVDGAANHAGTTPMDRRRDALLAAARFIEAVHDVVRGVPGRAVGTVGRVSAHPGAPNVVPGRVTLTLELRDLDMTVIERLFRRLRTEGDAIAAASGTVFRFERFYVSHAAPTDARLRRLIERAAARLDLETLRLPSGAGHDAQSLARLGPIGMIFVPSVGGISHAPAEFTRPEDVVRGARVLLHTLLAADGW